MREWVKRLHFIMIGIVVGMLASGGLRAIPYCMLAPLHWGNMVSLVLVLIMVVASYLFMRWREARIELRSHAAR